MSDLANLDSETLARMFTAAFFLGGASERHGQQWAGWKQLVLELEAMGIPQAAMAKAMRARNARGAARMAVEKALSQPTPWTGGNVTLDLDANDVEEGE